jgi:hypothetical protein
MAKQRIRQMQPKQIGQRRIGPVEIYAPRVWCEQAWLVCRRGRAVMHEWMHFCPCSFRPILINYR